MHTEQTSEPRVLVVRSERLADRVGAALAGARLRAGVESMPSYLSAMGWLSHHQAAVVIGPLSAMTGMVGSTARALRRLSPGARLVAVAEPDERAEAEVALAAGFDEVVYEPADATALLASLRWVAADSTDEPASATQAGPAADTLGVQDDSAAAPVMREHQADAVQTNDEPRGQPIAQPKAEAGPDWLSPVFDDAPAAAVSGEVGDIDLAEAVMLGEGALLPLAMRLLRTQSGIADAAYLQADEPPAPQAASADVVFAGHRYGALTSATADAGALGAWAAWLSRWVALDRRQADLYAMAMRDELTGLWNRRYFDRFLQRVLQHASEGRQQVTLLLFDIDNFKQYNDTFGHPAGDAILRSTATLIQSLVREHDVVARIGGDEFAVVFWDKGEPRHLGSQHPDNVIGIAKRFQKAICEHRFPALGEQAVGQLTVSGGLAGFPWDGRTPDELVARADAMALQSKRQGKNAICFGPGAAPNGNS